MRSITVAIAIVREAEPDMSDASSASHLSPVDGPWPECHVVDLRHGERVYPYRSDALAAAGVHLTR